MTFRAKTLHLIRVKCNIYQFVVLHNLKYFNKRTSLVALLAIKALFKRIQVPFAVLLRSYVFVPVLCNLRPQFLCTFQGVNVSVLSVRFRIIRHREQCIFWGFFCLFVFVFFFLLNKPLKTVQAPTGYTVAEGP